MIRSVDNPVSALYASIRGLNRTWAALNRREHEDTENKSCSCILLNGDSPGLSCSQILRQRRTKPSDFSEEKQLDSPWNREKEAEMANLGLPSRTKPKFPQVV